MDEPEKYIRTLAGDMAIVKKGNIPNLLPMRPGEVRGEEKPSTVPPLGIPLQTEIPQTTPEPLPVSVPTELPRSFEVASEERRTQTPLKTYAGDFRDRMKETQSSTVSVLAAEQDSARRPVSEPEQPESFSRSNIIYSIAGTVLLIAGVTGAYIAYTSLLGTSAPVVTAPVITAPIFVDDREEVSGTGTALMQKIQQSVNRQLAQGAVRFLYSAPTDSGFVPSVFSSLGVPAPGSLTRNIIAAGSMAGVVFTNGTQSPFFILSVSSYGDTFAAMLSWEQFMPRDLATLFPPYPAQAVSAPVATVSATSTPKVATTTKAVATTTPKSAPAPTIASATFYDASVANHDVRVYRDTTGRDILLYGYWNQKTLIIARSTTAFTEIVRRLGTSRTPQ